MGELSRAELARALGVAERDMIGRRAAATVSGVPYDTLRTTAAIAVAFWKLTDTSPALYRRDWVTEYGEWVKGGKKGNFAKEKCGKQAMPEAAKPRKITSQEATIVIERWKHRRLHKSIEVIFDGRFSLEEVARRHRMDWLKLYKPDGGEIPRGDPALEELLRTKVKELVLPHGVIEKPEVFTNLMHIVWTHVLQAQSDWIAKRQLIPR